MKTVIDSYKSSLLVRYDKDIAIPYYSPADFVGLKHEKNSFNNSDGINISYFTYWYDGYKEDEVIIFCTGIGPGHEAHFPEINSFCQAGYKVISMARVL